MPQFLQSLLGYTAQSAGMVLSAAAIILLIELPLVGQLAGRIQARYLIAFGWAVLTITMFFSTRRIDLQISFASATWLRIAQYVPIGFIFIPATMVAYLGLPQEKSNAVAGLVNFVRNIGSSVGTSAVTTILARRAQVHQVMLASHTSFGDSSFRDSATLSRIVSAKRCRPAGLAGIDEDLRHYAQSGVDALLHRYVLDAWNRRRNHVLLTFLLRKNNPRGREGKCLRTSPASSGADKTASAVRSAHSRASPDSGPSVFCRLGFPHLAVMLLSPERDASLHARRTGGVPLRLAGDLNADDAANWNGSGAAPA